MTARPARAAAAALALAVASFGCVTAPPAPPLPAWDRAGAEASAEADEREIWEESKRSLDEFAKENEDAFLSDAELERYLVGVAESLLPPSLSPAMPRPRAYVLRTAERNASASPHGALIVSTGMLAALADEAQLAGLLGHEVGHQVARHSLIKQRYERLTASTVHRMALSRAHEDEADRRSLDALLRAGYEPRGVVEMLTAIAEDDGVGRSPYPQFDSHPFVPERMRTLGRLLPSTAGQRAKERYEAAIAEMLLVDAELQLEEGDLARASGSIERHLRLRPASGRGWYWKAEYERRAAKEGRLAPAARAAYERAVELAPDDPDALRALGFLYREVGETERARELFGDYLRVAPDAPDRRLIERYLGAAGTSQAGERPAP